MTSHAPSRDSVRSLEFEHELLILDVTEQITRWIEESGITRAELARRLNRSRAWVARLLRHESNPTVRTLAAVARALGARWSTALLPTDALATVSSGSQSGENGRSEAAPTASRAHDDLPMTT